MTVFVCLSGCCLLLLAFPSVRALFLNSVVVKPPVSHRRLRFSPRFAPHYSKHTNTLAPLASRILFSSNNFSQDQVFLDTTPRGSCRGSTPTLHCAERHHEDLRNRLPSLPHSRDRTVCRCRRQSGLASYHKDDYDHGDSRGSGHFIRRRFDLNDLDASVDIFSACSVFIFIFIVYSGHSHRQCD